MWAAHETWRVLSVPGPTDPTKPDRLTACALKSAGRPSEEKGAKRLERLVMFHFQPLVGASLWAWFSRATGRKQAGVAASVSDFFTSIEVSLAVIADFPSVWLAELDSLYDEGRYAVG